jgi:RHS repeat-associated protein
MTTGRFGVRARALLAFVTLAVLVSAGTSSGAPSATLDGPTTDVLDDFNRGEENPVTQWGNWASTGIAGGTPLPVSQNVLTRGNSGTAYRLAENTGDSEAFYTIAAAPTNLNAQYLYVALQDVGSAAYDGCALVLAADGQGALSLLLRRYDDGAPTDLAPGVSVSLASGDKLLLRKTGSALEGWAFSGGVWTLRVSASGCSYSGGKIGVRFHDSSFGNGGGSIDDFGGTGFTTDPPPPPPVPATPVLDTFNRPNELPVSQGGNWAPAGFVGTPANLVSQALHPSSDSSSSYRQAQYTGDMEAYYTIAVPPASSTGQYLFIALQDVGTAAFDGYALVFGNGSFELRRYDNGAVIALASASAAGAGAGDKLLLRRVGTTVEGWLFDAGAWTLKVSASNQTLYGGAGRIGIRFFQNVGPAGSADDFGGGAISAASTSLTVIKNVVNDNGGTAAPSSWTMNVAGPTPLSFPGAPDQGTTNAVQPGDYRVTESAEPSGYALSYGGDCDADGDVTIALGETRTCTLTNNDQASTGPPPGQTFGGGGGGLRMHARCACGLFADPVSSRTGAFTTSVDDLDLPGTGVSFAWSRSYTSADSTVGRLGPGWTDSYSASLVVQPSGDVLLHADDGQQVLYEEQANGSFLGAPGSLSTLSAVTGGYELVRTDQVKYRFDTQGRLLSVKDRNDQGLTLAYDGQNRLASVTDAANRQATISYNASDLVSQVQTQDGRSVGYGYTAGRLTSVTDVRGKTWTYAYDAAGRLEKITDPLNHAQVTNVYGTDGRVSSQTDALGKQTTFAWNAGTETATATDANQKVWTHDYEEGVLVEEIDPLQNDTDLVPDDDLNTTAVTGPTNETTEMTYDAAGNLLTATAPPSLGNAQKTFVYNARNDVELVTDARGKVTDYAYNPTTGNLTTVTQDGIQVAAYTYDAAGRVETFTDGNEKTWTYAYFPATGYLQSSTDPLGNKTTYTYDAAGRVATRVDPKGNVAGCNCAADFTWAYAYNTAGQQLAEQNPLGHTTTNVYDDAGRLTSTTNALNRVTLFTYDDANRVLTETAPDPDAAGPLTAPVTTYTYDNVGNKLTERDPRGNTTTFAYDGANRPISTTAPDPDGTGPLPAPVTTHSYDPNGNLVSTVEPRGNVSGANPDDFRTTLTYDAAGRVLTETRPDPDGAGAALPPKTTHVYDPIGNLQSVKDGNDHLTSYTYDAAGRILTLTAPDLGVTTYTYDHAGNMLTRKDDNNHTTTFAYDNASRLVSKSSPDPDGPGPQGPAVTSYTYDANGNRLTVTDANGNATGTAGDGVTTNGYDRANRQTSIDYSDSTPDVTFTYDAVGNRLTMADGSGTETRSYDGLDRLLTVTRGSNTFSYAYDAASNVTRRTYPGSTGVDYTYDPLNRLATVVDSSNTTSYAYDPASNLVQTTLPSGNGYVESRIYDRAGRLTEVKNQKGANVLSHFVSTLDAVGNPTQVVRMGSLAETQTYTYDSSDRITGVCFQAGSCPGASDPFIRWTYDKVGNRLSEQRPTGTTSYTYDDRDRLLSAGSTTFAYDQNGNQTQKGARTFAYDLGNRLKSTAQSSSTTTYSYDGEGKRVQTTGDGTPGAPTLRTPCATATGDAGTATVSKPTGTVSGDLLVVGLAFEKGSDVTLTPPSGWTLIRRTNQSSNVGNATYRKIAGASEPSSYVFALSPALKWSIGACAIAGADAAAPIDVHNGASAASGNPTAPSLTTTGANRLVLAFYANKKPATYSSYTSPAGERFDAPNTSGGLPSNALASYQQAAAGATGAKSATASEPAEWVAQQIAITPAAAPGVTRFLWDVNHGLPQLALERDGNDSPLRSYTYGARRISQTAGPGTSYYHYDVLGSVANLTSSTGATQWAYSYEPFGTSRIETSNDGPTNFMKFTGEYLDPTALYHLRARQYDPTLGRFNRPDPRALGEGEAGASAYAYVANRPGVMIDPSGMVFRPSGHGPLMADVATSREDASRYLAVSNKQPESKSCKYRPPNEWFCRFRFNKDETARLKTAPRRVAYELLQNGITKVVSKAIQLNDDTLEMVMGGIIGAALHRWTDLEERVVGKPVDPSNIRSCFAIDCWIYTYPTPVGYLNAEIWVKPYTYRGGACVRE